jgi:ABC-type polar amino acid transport system ATPase subunit
MIRIKGITKSFGDHMVLKNFCLHVKNSEVVVIIGPSGSGKSTLLRCIVGLEQIDEGVIKVGNFEFAAHMRKDQQLEKLHSIRSEVGFVFQRFNLFNHLTAEQNITLALKAVKKIPEIKAKEIALKLLSKFNLEDKAQSYPIKLSGGEQQRVAIIRALALQPKIMLFDEVTSALDPELVGDVLRLMEQLANEGMTMIVVTHEMQFAEDVADRVVFIDKGQVVEEGSPEQIFCFPQHQRTKNFLLRIIEKTKGKEN